MPNVKISELPAGTDATGAELFAAVQNGETVQIDRDGLLHNVTDPADLQDPATKNYVDLAVAAINTNTGSRIVSGGGVAWTGTNFDYIISACDYIINGVQYSSAQTAVTLDPADATFDRIDTFYADVDGLAGVITGDPADNPVAPSVDPATQIALTFAYVVANTTEPQITAVDIYLENTEWTTSTNSSGTITLASTNNPYAGTKDIEGTNTAAGNLFTAVKPSGTLNPADYANLVLQIRSKATWPNPKAISIFWMSGTSSVGTAATLKHGTFGFDSSNTTSYQQIVIPTSAFNTGSSSADRIRFQITGGGSNIGWYIDNIILQGGGSTITAGDFSTNTSVSVANEIVLFADTTGKLGKRSTGSGIAKLVSGALSTISVPVRTVGCTIDGGGSAITTGKTKGFVTCPVAGTITGWSIGVDAGTATVKVWKKATGTAVPTVSDNINTSGVSLSSGTYVHSTTVSDFTSTAVAAGDIFAFNLSSVATAKELTFQLEITPT